MESPVNRERCDEEKETIDTGYSKVTNEGWTKPSFEKKKEVQPTLSYLTADYPTALRPTVCLLVCASIIRLFDFMTAP
jgi:hypothetical protein